MGCGKWKNWVILQLGAGFTWGAPSDRAQPQSKGEAKMCKQYRLNGMPLRALQKDSYHHPGRQYRNLPPCPAQGGVASLSFLPKQLKT